MPRRPELAPRVAVGALIASAMAVVIWVRLLPLSLDGVDAATRADATYRAADGRDYVYLGDYDSYAWLRSAATLLRSGTTCDAVVDGECRDTYANAPAGRVDIYHGSLHVAAIAALHRLLALWWPNRPLSASAFLVPVIAGALGVLPAFALGRRLAGNVGGWCAAVLVGVDPVFLARSVGADNDVWNVVLPLFMVWAASGALGARRLGGALVAAVAAAACAALHAAVWRGWVFAYDVLLLALIVLMLVAALACVLRRRDPRVWRAPALRRAALVLAVFYVATGVFTTMSGREQSYLQRPLELIDTIRSRVAPPPPVVAAPEAVQWPDMLATVAEALVPTLADIAALVGGQVLFFAGWLGLLLLLLPRRGWRASHFAVLLGGNFLYRYLLYAALTRTMVIAWLAVPLAVVVPMQAVTAEEGEDPATPLIVVIWFLAALYLSYEAVRLTLLLVAPFGLALGAALGRLYEWLRERATVRLPKTPRLAAALPAALIAGLMAVPIQRGAALARSAVPPMNDAWWDSLVALREQSPPDAIITTWWDFGYWVKYVAGRRTSADGGSLLTRIPLWTAQALLAADENESVGLLRMLDCGSDPQDSTGAFGALLADGVDAPSAFDALRRIVGDDAAGAREELERLGVAEGTRIRVLAATHCAPPPAYLVLSTRTILEDAWRRLGSWTPRPAAAADGVAHRAPLQTPAWVPCDAAEAGAIECPIDRVIDADGTRLESVRVDPEHPSSSRMRFRGPPAGGAAATAYDAPPALLLLAGGHHLQEVPFPSADGEFAVLLDVPGSRALIGRPDVLRSTFAQLVFLDGRYARRFKRVAERSTSAGERVVTYRVDWDGA